MSQSKIQRVAIANRGEAAVRFMRAARTWSRKNRSHVSVVAMYTTPDADASFVKMASAVVNLGEPFYTNEDGERRSVYVDVERIVGAAVDAGADAIWPGWGFLSESPEFAEACEREGINFIGPPGSAMRKMGDKIAAKTLAEEADVPVSPWSSGAVRTVEEATEHAERIGYPVLLKAAAGGGGRGIRKVRSAEDIKEAFASASAEAASAFGDDSLFVESFVSIARHIEVQILADKHGTVWALGTRDCSVQRRNQKVIEEAPAPGLEPEVERALCEASIRMAKACGYVGAGTCEYLLLEDERTFYFLEMNTRLQVEHTVTEEIYGFDLVSAQIDVATGRALPEGGPPEPRGVAVQCRLNAEDPDDGFAPRSGLLTRFAVPQGPGVRVDSGYSPGTTVPGAFDSNIAKIITWGADREEAWARSQTALRDTIVALDSGLTNRSLLLELVSRSDVRRGAVTTGWLGDYLENRPDPIHRKYLTVALAAAGIGDYLEERRGRLLQFFGEAHKGLPRRIPNAEPAIYRYKLGSAAVEVTVACLEPGFFRVSSGAWSATFHARTTGGTTLILEYQGHRHSAIRVSMPAHVNIDVEGVAHRLERSSDGRVQSSLPAAVTAIHVEIGQEVAVGDRLVTLEVMKMEMPVLAPLAGTIKALHVTGAAQVGVGDLLVEIEESGDGEVEEAPTVDAPLPNTQAAPRDPLSTLRSALLGFDIGDDELAAAREALRTGNSGAPLSALLALVRGWVVQDQLFQSGPYDDALNDAKASTVEQLAHYLRVRDLEDEVLSERFVRRIKRHFTMHGLSEPDRSEASDEALMRLFQAHLVPESKSTLLLLDVFAALGAMSPDGAAALEEAQGRAIFEKFANSAVQAKQMRLASAAWKLIHIWYDRPTHRKEMQRAATDAVNAVSALTSSMANSERRREAAEQLRVLPKAAVLAALPARFPSAEAHGQRLLRSLVERLYGTRDHEAVASGIDGVFSRLAWISEGRNAVVVLLPSIFEIPRALSELSAEANAVDFIVAAPPELDKLEELIILPAHVERATVMWSRAGDGLRARTWRQNAGKVCHDESVDDIHPASKQARLVGRYSKFNLTRLETPGGVFFARGDARDGSNDTRFLIVDVLDDFTVDHVGDMVRVPALEAVLLNAFHRLREELAEFEGRAPSWNRVTVIIRPVAHISRKALEAIALRMSPPCIDLGLEKIVLVGSFALDGNAPEELYVEWSNPIDIGVRVAFSKPRYRPLVILSDVQRKVISARRRQLYYPYEIVRLLTDPREGFSPYDGEFVEFELDEDTNCLVPADRPHGQNTANVVVGQITNRGDAFPGDLTRVIIMGDPTATMGSLGEAECRRINAAIDHAEDNKYPIEWLALSSGARISFDSGTENLDWTARTLARIIRFTQSGGVINVIVDGPCVGAQSYWNAEATMLDHCRGALIMTPRGYMVLTGKRALEYSGSVAAETNSGIGGLEIMTPNGEAQYTAPNLQAAYELLFQHYELTYVPAGQGYTVAGKSSDRIERDVSETPYAGVGDFATVGDVFSEAANPGRKKPFSIREAMRATLDSDAPNLERWSGIDGGETAVVLHGKLGGQPVCMIGIESVPVKRKGSAPIDGPDQWMSGTLFPESSRKVARAINTASGLMPVVVLANLSGFDGSPESLRQRQLEFGAQIGRAVVNFEGPIVFCVVSRYHGGAYVVFSQGLNRDLQSIALEGSYASVIGGAPAAAVVFPRLVRKRVSEDPRVIEAGERLDTANPDELAELQQAHDDLRRQVESEVQMAVAREFDAVHSVQRAMDVGSLSGVISTPELRAQLCERVREGVALYNDRRS